MAGAVAGAAAAIVVMEIRLRQEMAFRPQIGVADYSLFIDALASGGDPNVLRVLADQYTAQAAQAAGRGVLLLRSDAIAGGAPSLVLPHDPRVVDLVSSLTARAGRPGGVQPTPQRDDAAEQSVGAGDGEHSLAGMRGDGAAALLAALRAGRPATQAAAGETASGQSIGTQSIGGPRQ
jgi:hypothetical protein